MGRRKQFRLTADHLTITIFNDKLDGVDEYSLRRKTTKSHSNLQLSSFINLLSNIINSEGGYDLSWVARATGENCGAYTVIAPAAQKQSCIIITSFT